jgi:hypothetical protein
MFHPIVRRLKNQFVSAERKIGFGILPAHRQLAYIFEMPLSLMGSNRLSLRCRAFRPRRLVSHQ